MILFCIGLLLIGLVLYSTFCWTPGRETRKEEKEHSKWSDYIKEEEQE